MRVRLDFFFVALFSFLTLLSLVWPEWIELLFRFDPDRGDGRVEWAIVVMSGLAAVGSAVLLAWDFRLRRRAGRAS